jgi:hypothetical protein
MKGHFSGCDENTGFLGCDENTGFALPFSDFPSGAIILKYVHTRTILISLLTFNLANVPKTYSTNNYHVNYLNYEMC